MDLDEDFFTPLPAFKPAPEARGSGGAGPGPGSAAQASLRSQLGSGNGEHAKPLKKVCAACRRVLHPACTAVQGFWTAGVSGLAPLVVDVLIKRLQYLHFC